MQQRQQLRPVRRPRAAGSSSLQSRELLPPPRGSRRAALARRDAAAERLEPSRAEPSADGGPRRFRSDSILPNANPYASDSVARTGVRHSDRAAHSLLFSPLGSARSCSISVSHCFARGGEILCETLSCARASGSSRDSSISGARRARRRSPIAPLTAPATTAIHRPARRQPSRAELLARTAQQRAPSPRARPEAPRQRLAVP